MAESTLAVTLAELEAEIGHAAGYGRSGYTARQQANLDAFVKSTQRLFYFPPALPNESQAHEWSFLRPTTTLTIFGTLTATVSGTPSYSAPASTITATAAAFYNTMVGDTVTFATSGNSYTIAAYTSATEIDVTGDASSEAAGDSITIAGDGNFPLPDDFGGLEGPVTITPGVQAYDPARITTESRIRDERSRWGTSYTGPPTLASTRPLARSAETASVRFELLVWPYPDKLYTVEFPYLVLPDAIGGSALYQAGAAQHAETLLAAGRAIVEQKLNQVHAGPEWSYFILCLQKSVKFDRQLRGTQIGRYNGDRSDQRAAPTRRSSLSPTYNGTVI